MSTNMADGSRYHSLPDRAAQLKRHANGSRLVSSADLPGDFADAQIREIASRTMCLSDDEFQLLFLADEPWTQTIMASSISSCWAELYQKFESAGASNTELFVLSLTLKISAESLAGPIDEIVSKSGAWPIKASVVADYVLKTLAVEHAKVGLELAIFECNAAIKNNFINPTDTSSAIRMFAELHEDNEYINYICSKYPLFESRLVERSLLVLESISIFLARLAKDIELIRAKLGFGQHSFVSAIHQSDGDSHNGGKRVAVVEFDGGYKCVYKPRSVEGERTFQIYLCWLNELTSRTPFKIVWVISKTDYGWMEFIDARGMADQKDVEEYYFKYGGLMAAVHYAVGTDIHYENLVASGNCPVIVDLETIIQPIEYAADEADSKKYLLNLDYFAHSPLYTAMLDPSFLDRTLAGSPLAANEIQDPTNVVIFLNEQGELVLKIARDINDHKYLPRLSGETVNFAGYIESIIDGYRDVSQRIALNRPDLVRTKLQEIFSEIRVRVILRYTAHYAGYISALYSPYAMQSERNSDELLSKLWQVATLSKCSSGVVPSEYRDLWRGDIPYFSAAVRETAVFDSTGRRIGGLLRSAGIDVARNRILCVTLETIEEECSLLRYCLTMKAEDCSTGRGLTGPSREGSEYLPKDWRGIYRLIGKRIVVQNGRALFMDPVTARDLTISQAVLGPDFYSGLPGVVFSLAYCDQQDVESGLSEKIRDIAEATLLSGGMRQHEIGACKGIGGSIYLASHLGAIWDDPYYLELGKALAQSVNKLSFHDRHFDIFSGAAGAILAVDSLASVCGESALDEILEKLVTHLVKHSLGDGKRLAWMSSIPSDGPTTGFAHGVSGIAYALLRAYLRLQIPKIKDVVLGAERFLSDCFRDQGQHWTECLTAEQDVAGIEAWCHGSPGITLFYDELARVIPESDFGEKAAIGLKKTLECASFENDSICHGTLGNIDLLISRQGLEERGTLDSLLREYQDRPVRCGNDRGHVSISMFTGLAGCAYQLLRAEKVGGLPSVATFGGPLVGKVQ